MDNSNLTLSGAMRINDKYANKGSLFEECRSILSKSYESRLPGENHTLFRLLERS
jgi:hypothetical protein